ncbi:M15 family metallopeptidase [Ferrimonas marina]|uniref:LD-carboxypeptidase LdcB, LAS superfamily n=1 Tax=Ferrimonas marina TaxID=299255 RepID=A0A1M5YUV1_9GAMM|nr:M15 family metallopeptidase [Ferrimonas marina]SHI15867.1 LD-carboxypeptidase LdcB, LAS superfamily [Ferrimonas marina]
MLTPSQLLGLDDEHLVDCQGQRLERRTARAFEAMAKGANEAGFALNICSGWRSFERQQRIFNGKARGERPLQDGQGRACQVEQMSEADILDAILAWSALPGTSRHHWGTDLDVYDGNRIEASALKLEPWEYQEGGPCHELSQWLEQNMADYGFFRPYREDLGGVRPEPWHLSYQPLAVPALKQFDAQALAELLEGSDLALKQSVLAQLPGLIDRYCFRIAEA